MTTVTERWMSEPLTRFVDDARVLMALLLEPDGRVLAQYGFARSLDVMSAAALAATVQASSAEYGRQLGEPPLGALYHAGASRQIYLAPVPLNGTTLIFLTVFDTATSLGLVRLYFRELQQSLTRAAPADRVAARATDDEAYERELRRSLAQLFGRG